MITFLVLLIIAWLYDKKSTFVVTVSSCFFWLIFLLFDGDYLFDNWLESDMKRYYEESPYKVGIFPSERWLWYVINYLVYNDFLGIVFIRLINVPIIALFFGSVAKLFKQKGLLLYFALPYVFYLGTLNIRDLLILLILVKFAQSSGSLLTMFWIVVLSTLRSFLIPLTGIKYFKRIRLKTVMFVVIIGCIGFYLSRDRISFLIEGITSGFFQQRMLEADLPNELRNSVNSPVKFYFFAVLRYVFTPFPNSLLTRLLDGTAPVIPELLRVLHQILYYVYLLYLLTNANYIRRVWMKLSYDLKSFLFILFMHAPIYAFYLFGGQHQRTKVPFQLAIFLFCVLIYDYRRSKNKTVY